MDNDKKFKGIVDELLDYAPLRDRELFIESRGAQVIASALHLIRLIKESYDSDVSDDLVKRLMRSIANADEEKFKRGLRNLREAKANKRANPL